jgi:hypothetical protein
MLENPYQKDIDMLLKMLLALMIGCFINSCAPSTVMAYHEIGGEAEDSAIDFIPEPANNDPFSQGEEDDDNDFEDENEGEEPVGSGNYRD